MSSSSPQSSQSQPQPSEETDPLVAQFKLPSTANLTTGHAVLQTTQGHEIAVAPATCQRPHGRCLLVGRQAATADVRIQHASLSRQHAVLYYTDNDSKQPQLWLQDLGGKHGTHVNGQRIEAHTPTQLLADHVLQFGKVRESLFTVQFVQQPASEATENATTSASVSTSAAAEPAESASATASASASNDAPQQQQQQQLLQSAGQGLTGRAKREAELAAMMDSLDQNITYQAYQAPEPPTNVAPKQSQQKQKQPSKYPLPITELFDVPPPDDLGSQGVQKKPLAVTCLAVDPSGSRFAVGSRDTHLRWYDFAGLDRTRREPFEISIVEDGHAIQDAVYSPTGDRLLVATGSAQPTVMSRQGQDALVQFVRGDMYVREMTHTKGHTAAVTAVDWHSLENDVVLTSSLDGTARLWNVKTGKMQFQKLCCDKVYPAKSLKGHKTGVTSVAFHPGGREFVLGTACGTLQRWSTARTHRAEKVIAVNDRQHAITFVTYSLDGKQVACRSAVDGESNVYIYNSRLSPTEPVITCLGLPTLHEQANFAFSPDGKFGVAGATAMVKDEALQKLQERGSLNFYKLSSATKGQSIEPIVALETSVGPIRVQWHKTLNQILVGGSDGGVTVYYDTKLSKNGALISTKKSGRVADDLSILIRSRAPEGLKALTGDIVAPFSSEHHKKRKRKGEEEVAPDHLLREPERPAANKHKFTTGSGVSTFQQFIAQQNQPKAIAGMDPRAAIMKYSSATDNDNKVLDTKTVEEEEEEERKGKQS